jgi:dihydroxyacid dehydratase/phosphogluconate dehydratase
MILMRCLAWCRYWPNLSNRSADTDLISCGRYLGLIRGVLNAGLLHGDVRTVAGDGLMHYEAMKITVLAGRQTWLAYTTT